MDMEIDGDDGPTMPRKTLLGKSSNFPAVSWFRNKKETEKCEQALLDYLQYHLDRCSDLTLIKTSLIVASFNFFQLLRPMEKKIH